MRLFHVIYGIAAIIIGMGVFCAGFYLIKGQLIWEEAVPVMVPGFVFGVIATGFKVLKDAEKERIPTKPTLERLKEASAGLAVADSIKLAEAPKEKPAEEPKKKADLPADDSSKIDKEKSAANVLAALAAQAAEKENSLELEVPVKEKEDSLTEAERKELEEELAAARKADKKPPADAIDDMEEELAALKNVPSDEAAELAEELKAVQKMKEQS